MAKEVTSVIENVEQGFYRSVFRMANWMANFAVAAHNIGAITTFKIFLYERWRQRIFRCELKNYGIKWWMSGKSDFNVMHQFWYRNYRITEHKDSPIRWIIDAGANIGDSSLRFLHFHPSAQIIALEPEEKNADILQRNLGGFSQVKIERKGLWHKTGFLQVNSSNSSLSHNLVDGGDGPSVAVTTVQDLCEKYGIDRIGILKLDIEGAEGEIFSHSAAWIHRCDCIVWELNDHQCPGALQKLIKQLEGTLYNFTIVDEYLIGIRFGSGLEVKNYRFLGQE